MYHRTPEMRNLKMGKPALMTEVAALALQKSKIIIRQSSINPTAANAIAHCLLKLSPDDPLPALRGRPLPEGEVN